MTWKKTWFSYILWAFYSVIICAALGMGIFTMLSEVLGHYIIIGIVCLFLLLWTGLWFLIQYLISKKKSKVSGSKKQWAIVEGMSVGVIIIAGSIGYYFLLRQIDLSALARIDLLQNSFVDGSMEIVKAAYGAEWIFMYVLRGLFLFVGNHAGAALWLQFVMQLLAALITYRGMRKVSNPVMSVVSLGGLVGLYLFLVPQALLNPGWMAFFLFAIGFYFLTSVFRSRNNEILYSKGKMLLHYFGIFVLGLYISLIVYIDFNSVILLLLGISLLWSIPSIMGTEYPKMPNRFIQVLCLIIGSVTGLLTIMLLVATCYKMSLMQTLSNWWSTYSININITALVDTVRGGVILTVVLCAILLWGALGFLRENKESSYDGVYILWIGTAVLSVLGISVVNSKSIWIFVVLIISAVYCMGRCFSSSAVMTEFAESENIKKESTDVETVVEEVNEVKENKSSIKFLENPLPGPKKHVSKTLDYDLKDEELVDLSLNYDIEVSEDDDFDL